VRTVVHQRLLQTDIASEALVVSDRPRWLNISRWSVRG
jgi:hypothetical protein